MEKVITSQMGETFFIRQNATQTNGQFIEIDIEVKPGKIHRPLHIHPKQSEYFKVLEGTLSLQVNNEVKKLQAGDELTILPNTHHCYWNDGNANTTVKTILSPALNFEEFLFTITELEKKVATNEQGVPTNKLIAAQFVNKFKNIMQPSDVPKLVIKAVFPLLSFISSSIGNRLPKFALMFIGIFMFMQSGFAQSKFPKNTISINAFRNPSIGLEYQHKQISVHAGYYPTNFESGVTTEFLKAGVTYWFLPVGKKEIPSSFYGGLSYLRGMTRDYKDKNALGIEAGFRWYVWQGLNLRIGVIALAAQGQDLKINPTPSISYSIKF
ncbi:MAG: hypothetical protein OHK0038_27320 [Flammeovirgaceae bacterium]